MHIVSFHSSLLIYPSFFLILSHSLKSMEKGKNIFCPTSLPHQLTTLTLTLLGLALPMPMPNPAESGCTASATTKYRLTFTGKWSQMAFPKQYPLYRPPAQWSPLIGGCTSVELTVIGGKIARLKYIYRR